MPLEKQSLNNFLPEGFETLNQEGHKENFTEDKIKTGYEKDIPDIVSGPNLNNLIDVVGKNTNTLNNYVEYLNGMPINNVPTVNANGQLDYTNLDDKLTKKQITNCILEIPQRIKYTLEEGTLTIKAGTVLMVPYGVEDKTSQYPKGATFLNDNFKVYDTQFVDGKFFVWAEVVNDIIENVASTLTRRWYFSINITANSGNGSRNSESGTNNTSTGTYTIYYNTSTNIVKSSEDTTTLQNDINSLPILTGDSDGTNYYGTVSQVFNGIGYIGSFVWVDKGVKCLMPDGRNTNGTLKNIEFTTQKVHLGSRDVSGSFFIFLTNVDIQFIQTSSYDDVENFIYSTGEGFQYHKNYCQIGSCGLTNGVVSNFATKNTIKFVDSNDIGQWVNKTMVLIDSQTSFSSGQERKYDLSEYLPNDGAIYEVILSASIITAASSGSSLNLLAYTDFLKGAINVCRVVTRSNAIMYSAGSVTLVVGQQRTISLAASTGSSGTNYADAASVKGYRKVG